MKSYLDLAAINARHNAKQNRMTILCIILAVFLVTSVFSMVDFEYIHMSQKLIRDHGNWHVFLRNMPKEEAENIWNEADVKATCWYDTMGYNLDKDFFLDGHRVCFIGTEKSYCEDIMVGVIKEGRFPENDTEVMLNINAKNMGKYDIGDAIAISTPAGEYTYTISGFVVDTSNSLATDAVIAMLDYPAYETLAKANNQEREEIYYVQFRNSRVRETIARIKEAHGWTDENIDENTALLGMTGMSTNDYVVGLYSIAAVLVMLVVLAGIFMISGSMNTTVAERTQFFGMLRCIGAGKNQVRHIVIREALTWLKTAIPIGTLASILVCWGICASMAYGIGGEWEDMPIGRISIIGIVMGALIGFVTVLISAGAPARRAAKVSPIAAVSGNQTSSFSGQSLKTGKLSVDVSLGMHHATGKKKNLLLMTGSFALSIILFLSFSVLFNWIDNALTSNKPYTPDVSIYYDDYDARLDQTLINRIRSIEGVKYAYGRMYANADVTSDKNVTNIDFISYDDIQFTWAKKECLKGNIDETHDTLGNVMVVYWKKLQLDLGDTFQLNGKTLHVTAVLSDSPFSEGDIPTVICSEETFMDVMGQSNYSVIDLQLNRKATDETIAAIRSYLDNDIRLGDRRESKEEANSTYLAFTVLTYSFLSLIALIAVFNIINSISMSVIAKRRQYGMMRAIGLEAHQLAKMVMAEAMTYASSGFIAGCMIGIPMHAWLFNVMVTSHWGTPWKFPLIQVLCIFIIVFISALIAVHNPVKRLSKSSIIETIRT